MSKKYSRSGGKFNGNHTTLTPLASAVADIAEQCACVTKISPGFIKAGLKSANNSRRIKITNKGSCLLLSVRDNSSHQEVYVYTTDIAAAKLAIAKGVKGKDISVTFA